MDEQRSFESAARTLGEILAYVATDGVDGYDEWDLAVRLRDAADSFKVAYAAMVAGRQLKPEDFGSWVAQRLTGETEGKDHEGS